MKNNKKINLAKTINNLSFENKSKIILFIIVAGIVLIGTFAQIRLYAMRQNFDIVYQRKAFTLKNLEELKDIYDINVFDTLRDMQRKQMSAKQAKTIINSAQKLIEHSWEDYKIKSKQDVSFFAKTINKIVLDKPSCRNLEDFEQKRKSLEHKIESRIEKANLMISQIFWLIKTNQKSIAVMVMDKELYPTIHSIKILLTHLINFNIGCLRIGKSRIDSIYKATFAMTIAFSAFTIILLLSLAYLIMSNISSVNKMLEKKVEKSTEELKKLNLELEKKVEKEAQKSREKDRIMFQQARFAAMGEMIGNIAHQWRQPLSALTLIIQSFETKMLSGKLSNDFVEKQVKKGMNISNRMSQTINDFRNFFNPHKTREDFNVEETVKNSISLVKELLDEENIQIIIENQKDDLLIHGHENEFSQVILNLLTNAYDSLKNKEIEEKIILIKISAEKNTLLINIIDSGGGIDKKIIDKIFEPYFTTKHKSFGTGIGLYMSKQIIENQMKGTIEGKNIKFCFSSKKCYNCASFVLKLKYNE